MRSPKHFPNSSIGHAAELATRVARTTGEVDANTIDPNDLILYTEHVTNMDPLLFMQMLQSVGERSAESWLADIDIPVLVIAGQQDSFTPPYLAETMAARIPNSELFVVEGATHVVPIERREMTIERVRAFIDKCHQRTQPSSEEARS